ncbi:MAG: S8 family peptidase [Lachnospiraceae bacterium]|nr:S8 family peptidase [Lachnospiraceae bacterium]
MSCTESSSSEDYADFIIQDYSSAEELSAVTENGCIDFINRQFAILHVPRSSVRELEYTTYTYSAIPKLYSLLDLTSMEASGITKVSSLPAFSGRGAGVIIGFIDTGIDYRNPVFQNPGGTTRILGIWDQTEGNGNEVPGSRFSVSYGTQYTKKQIDEALRSDDPLSVVPSTDSNGHGTFLASVAAGGEDQTAGFSGAAPGAWIGMVKLKPAKQYLRDFYLIQDSADAFQENDIMMGIAYLLSLAEQYSAPIAICIGLGTNMGSHTGRSSLGIYMDSLSSYSGTAFVVAAGNETGFGHHYRGIMEPDETVRNVELRIGEQTRGFSMELWAEDIGAYSIGFISPTGQIVQGLPAGSERAATLNFLVENTRITVYSRIAARASGSQMVFIRVQDPLPGIWTIVVTSVIDIRETFHIWLPCRNFIPDDTRFLQPDPDTLITGPGNTQFPITVAAYNHNTGGIYIHSSRGYSRSGQIKPELAAPGVDILGASLRPGSYIRMTGTSVAAAHTAGAAALLLSWGILGRNDFFMNSASIKTYLIRGAERNPALTYPNRQFGYGTLDLYQAFLRLRI